MSRVDYTHLTIECLDCEKERLNAASEVRKALRDAASICKLHILNEHIHEFLPQGITGYVLLSESHISIHTWPEKGFALVDVLSCASVQIDLLIECFRESMRAKTIDVRRHAQESSETRSFAKCL